MRDEFINEKFCKILFPIQNMTSNFFAFFATLIFLIGLFLYIKMANKYTEDWYGENSFLKKPKSYFIKFSNLVDFDFLIATSFILIPLIYLNEILNCNDGYEILIFLFFITLLIPTFIFLKKWIFYKVNGNKEFHFDIIKKQLTIKNGSESIINFSEILELNFYRLNSKMTASFAIISLKNQDKIVLTELLRCYLYLPDFFAGINQNQIEIGYLKLYDWLKWIRVRS